MSLLTVKELEELQSLLCDEHLDYQMELLDGKIVANKDLRAPDVTFVRAERLRRSPRDFAEG